MAELHKAVFEEMAAAMAAQVTTGMLVSSEKGAWDFSDGMSGLFPDYNFIGIEQFLTDVWEAKQTYR